MSATPLVELLHARGISVSNLYLSIQLSRLVNDDIAKVRHLGLVRSHIALGDGGRLRRRLCLTEMCARMVKVRNHHRIPTCDRCCCWWWWSVSKKIESDARAVASGGETMSFAVARTRSVNNINQWMIVGCNSSTWMTMGDVDEWCWMCWMSCSRWPSALCDSGLLRLAG